jgi:hypothetical protein
MMSVTAAPALDQVRSLAHIRRQRVGLEPRPQLSHGRYWHCYAERKSLNMLRESRRVELRASIVIPYRKKVDQA